MATRRRAARAHRRGRDRTLAGAGRNLSSPALDVLALAPLPYLEAGARSFEGGVTVFYETLLPLLARRGHRLRVLAEAPPARRDAVRVPLDPSVPGLEIEAFAFDYRSSSDPPGEADLARVRATVEALVDREVARARPDVVLLGREISTLYALARCERHGVPVVVVSHGLATAALTRGEYQGGLAALLVDLLCRAARVVTVGRHLEDDLRRLGVARVATITNVADPERFRPMSKDAALLRALAIVPDDVVVGHVSVLRKRKRPLDLVDSAAEVLRAHPEAVYLVIGDGPCRAEMEEAVRRHGIGARFRFAGQVPHDAIPRHLSLADVVVIPSDTEGFPLVYRETQACGRVLVASDIAPAREAIVDGESGVLFRTGDVPDLVRHTARLVADPALRARIGAGGRAVAEAEGPEAWCDAWEAILRAAARR